MKKDMDVLCFICKLLPLNMPHNRNKIRRDPSIEEIKMPTQ